MSGTVSRRRGSYQGGHYKDKHFPSTASPAEALAKVGQPLRPPKLAKVGHLPTANPCKGKDVAITRPDPVLTGMK